MNTKNKSLLWPIAALSSPVVLEKRANARREEKSATMQRATVRLNSYLVSVKNEKSRVS